MIEKNKLTIKKYDGKHDSELAKLISLHHEEKGLLTLLQDKRVEFSYAAFYENKVAGILIAWKSNVHPHRTYFRILSHPLFNAKVEERLLLQLEELNKANRILQTSIWETAFLLKQLYEDNGFREIRRTYMPKLHVKEIHSLLPYQRMDKNIKTVKETISDEARMHEWTLLVKKNYEHSHLVNPVARMKKEKWRERMLADDLIPEGSYMYLDNRGKLIAYAFLHQSEHQDALELGWCGANNAENRRYIPLLVAQQIQFAARRNCSFLIGEFDTTDRNALEVLKRFPFEPSPTWITYQK